MGVERIRRPELDRKKPIRSFTAGPSGDAPRGDSARESGDGGFVEAGVRAAYSVMDAYLRRGRRVARELGRYSMPGLGGGSDSRERHARFLELTSELAANWFDLLGLVTEAVIAIRDDAGRGPDVEVAYEIASTQAARVRLEFLPGRATARLASPGLRCLDPEATPIAAEFEAADAAHLLVKIRVPAAQPPGLYAGVVSSLEDGTAVGALSLELRA